MHLQTKQSTWIVPSRRAVWIPAGLIHHVVMSGSVMMRTLYFHPSMKVFEPGECMAVNVSNLMHELIIHVCEQGIVTPNSIQNRSLIQLVTFQSKNMSVEPLMLPMPDDETALRVANSLLHDPSTALSSLAKANLVSLRTLQRVFAIETGMSIGRWRSQARLLSSLPMLEEGRQVTDVSMALGFESLSAFISAFRKFFGVTPSKYFHRSSGN